MARSVIAFRRLTRADFPMMARWLAAPHIQRWWREDATAQAVEANYGPSVDGVTGAEHFVVDVDRKPIGFLQRYPIDTYPEYDVALRPSGTPRPAVSLDYFIGDPARIGQGLGPAILRQAVEDAWRRYPNALAIVVAVQHENRRSWRALEKVGFQRAWSGMVESGDPSDAGPSHVYVLQRRK